MSVGVYILLASYNGERFLRPQIESLLEQTFGDWKLLVRDDGSNDGTLGILAEFASRDSRIVQLENNSRVNSGPVSNYGALLKEAHGRGAQNVFCCDQDDIWLPKKLELMLPLLEKAGEGGRLPCLVHHDLEVVDEDLHPLADSFCRLMALAPQASGPPGRLLSRNEVTGCALGCNRALLDMALPVPGTAIMHDWWLALYAAYSGCLVPVKDRLVRYRQHGENRIGAKSYRAGLNPASNWLSTWRLGMDELLDTMVQAGAFAAHAGAKAGLKEEQLEAIGRYAAMLGKKRMARLATVSEVGAWRRKWLLDAVLLARLMTMRKAAMP